MIKVQEILDAVESEYDMGGLSSGLYGEYAADVAERVARASVDQLVSEYKNGKIYVSDMQERLSKILSMPDS